MSKRPLMMSDFRGDEGSKITPKNWTLEGKCRTLGGGEVKNRRTSFMDDPDLKLLFFKCRLIFRVPPAFGITKSVHEG